MCSSCSRCRYFYYHDFWSKWGLTDSGYIKGVLHLTFVLAIFQDVAGSRRRQTVLSRFMNCELPTTTMTTTMMKKIIHNNDDDDYVGETSTLSSRVWEKRKHSNRIIRSGTQDLDHDKGLEAKITFEHRHRHLLLLLKPLLLLLLLLLLASNWKSEKPEDNWNKRSSTALSNSPPSLFTRCRRQQRTTNVVYWTQAPPLIPS